MKQLSNRKLLLLVVLFWSFVPVRPGSSQIPSDSIVQRVNSVAERVEAAKEKTNVLESKLQSYPGKIQTFDSLLSLMQRERTVVKTRVKIVATKTRPAPSLKPSYKDSSGNIIEPQYVARPVIIFKACEYSYGGDTFRTDMWKAPGEDGLIKQLFKKRK